MNARRELGLTYLLLLITVTSCRKDPVLKPDIIENYLFLSHTRVAVNPGIYEPLEGLDYDSYPILLLGGDLANLTSLDTATMEHVDSIFNFKAKSTLWALGNHDYSNLDLITAFTDKPPYYAYYQNEITFIVLDTQDSLSNIIGEQLEMVNNILDTVTFSKKIILLTHKLIWMRDNVDLDSQIDVISNGIKGDCFHCVNQNNFYSAVYPRLIEKQKNGIQIFCLAGDIGFKTNEFQYISPEGITFLATGVDYTKDVTYNKVIIFEHNRSQNILHYKYTSVSDL